MNECKEPGCSNSHLPDKDYCLDHLGNAAPNLRFHNHTEQLSKLVRAMGDLDPVVGKMMWHVQVLVEEYARLELKVSQDHFLKLNPEYKTMDEFNDGDMKLRINTFLWSNLPGDVTINEAEKVALGILDLMKGVFEDVQRRRENAKPVLQAEHRQENSGRFA